MKSQRERERERERERARERLIDNPWCIEFLRSFTFTDAAAEVGAQPACRSRGSMRQHHHRLSLLISFSLLAYVGDRTPAHHHPPTPILSFTPTHRLKLGRNTV